MLQVPVYDRSRTDIGPLRTPQATAPSAGDFAVGARQNQQLGQALGQATDQLDRIAQRDGQQEAFEAEAEIKRAWLDYSSQLQKNRQGVGAKGVTGEVEKWWAETGSKRLETVSSPLARRMLQSATQRLQLASMEQYTGWEQRQLEVAADASFESNIKTTVDSILQEPSKADLHRSGIQAAFRAQAVTKGWDEATYNQRLNAALQAASVAQYQGVLRTGGPAAAQAFLNDPKNGLSADQRSELEKRLKPELVEAKAEQFVASISGKTLDEQITAAQAIKDPDERKAAVAKIRENDDLREIARRRVESQASDTIWQLIGQGAAMKALPKDVLARMDGRERTAVAEHYRAALARTKTESGGGSVKTDLAVYEKLVNMPPEEFLAVRLSTYQDKIGRGDLEKLIDRQAKLRNPTQAGDVASSEQQMGTYVATLGLKDEKKGAFQQAAYNEFEQFRRSNKKEPTYAERQVILDRLTMQHDGGWFGSSKRLFEVPATPESRTEFVNKLVPKTELDQIRESLRKAGLPATNELILDMYRRTLSAK